MNKSEIDRFLNRDKNMIEKLKRELPDARIEIMLLKLKTAKNKKEEQIAIREACPQWFFDLPGKRFYGEEQLPSFSPEDKI